MRKKTWFILAIIVLVAVVGYFSYLFLGHSGTDSLTVSEFKSKAESFGGQQLMIEGRVAPGSVDWNDQTRMIRFALTDDRESLDIIYNGIAPDNFKPGATLDIRGKYRSDGVFEALSFGQPSAFCGFCH